MDLTDLFTPGSRTELAPEGDVARQAIDSIRGYIYQALAASLAWIDLDEKGRLFLEVAEDYAILVSNALSSVQVKDIESPGSVTLNTASIRDAIASFVGLVHQNPGFLVDLRYQTTSDIGTEQLVADRPAGMAGLQYWRNAAAGADPLPLRKLLESDKFPEAVRSFVKSRDDNRLRHDLLQRIHWDCGKPNFSTLQRELEERLVVVGRDKFGLPAPEARRLLDSLVYRVLATSVRKVAKQRVLTRADFYTAVDEATRVSVSRKSVE